jgi:hypothetical protein
MNGLAKYCEQPDLTAENSSLAPTEYNVGCETMPLMQCISPPLSRLSTFLLDAAFVAALRGRRRETQILRYLCRAIAAGGYRCLREDEDSSSPFAGRQLTPARFKILRALGMSARAARSAI